MIIDHLTVYIYGICYSFFRIIYNIFSGQQLCWTRPNTFSDSKKINFGWIRTVRRTKTALFSRRSWMFSWCCMLFGYIFPFPKMSSRHFYFHLTCWKFRAIQRAKFSLWLISFSELIIFWKKNKCAAGMWKRQLANRFRFHFNFSASTT